MNKQELILAVARRLDVSRARATEITDLFFAADGLIAGELKRGGRMAISGFGSFQLRRRAPREGRNPRTGKVMSIRGSLVPTFRAGRALKDVSNADQRGSAEARPRSRASSSSAVRTRDT